MLLQSIDTKIAERLKDREFRREWFRAELEQNVPAMFRDLREERGLTQTDLADLVEMKQSAVSRFEKSAAPKWNFETLLRLAEALDAQLVVSLLRSEDVIKRYAEEVAQPALESISGQQQVAPATITHSILEGPSNYETAWYSGERRHQPISRGLSVWTAQRVPRSSEIGGAISVQEGPGTARAAFGQERVRARDIQRSAHQQF